jgi:hypothetical protein
VTVPQESLAPVRQALVARAEAYAELVRAAAQAEARATREAAHEEAELVLRAAREGGAADAEKLLVGRRARTRTQCRAVLLGARRQVFEDFRGAARREAGRLVGQTQGLVAWLHDRAREVLGGDAEFSCRPDGSIVAVQDGRRWSWSPDELVDAALEDLGAEVQTLWTP